MKKEEFSTILNNFLKSRVLLGFVIFVFVLKVSTSLVFVNFPNNIFFADITKSTLVNLLNQSRQSFGLNSLTESQKLDQAAQLKAEDMVKNGYFSHTSPAGTTPWHWFSQAGYNYKYAGENLAIGFYDSKEVYTAWLNSPSHKENMVNPNYTEVGTAVLGGFGNNNAIVVVQLFGSQKTIKPATTNSIVNNTKTTATNPAVNTAPATEPKNEVVNTNTQNKETTPSQTETVGEKVLSSSVTLEADKKNTVNDFYSRFLNFALYSYDTFLQYIIYALLIILSGTFTYILSFNFNKEVNNGLVLRSLVLIAILFSSALINKDLIISILPHQIII
jgi:uncharacterized protein YkwD